MLGMNPLTLLELLGQPEFRIGFALGLAGLAVVLVLRVIPRIPKPGWLLVWGIAAFAALARADLLHAVEGTPGWATAVTVGVAVLGAAAFRILLARAPAWSVGLVFAGWVLGVWGTVPDTERAAVTLGAMTAMVPALWPGLRVRIGWEGAVVAIAALGFVAVTDGAVRTPAMIGSFGMVGMPIAAAAVLRFRKGYVLAPWWLVAAMAVHVIVSGRIAGQNWDPRGSLAIVILSSIVTGVGLAWGLAAPRPARARR